MPINIETLANDHMISDLTRWRKRFMRLFLTQFPASFERTRSWLKNVVLPGTDRILFFICDRNGSRIGNVGVCGLKPEIAELDNLIRGEMGGDPQLIFYSEIALLSWLYWHIGVRRVKLHVFTNNHMTIALHKRAGFKIVNTHTLTRSQVGEEIQFLVDSHIGEPVDFGYYEMAIEKDEFCVTNPWAETVYKKRMDPYSIFAGGV